MKQKSNFIFLNVCTILILHIMKLVFLNNIGIKLHLLWGGNYMPDIWFLLM